MHSTVRMSDADRLPQSRAAEAEHLATLLSRVKRMGTINTCRAKHYLVDREAVWIGSSELYVGAIPSGVPTVTVTMCQILDEWREYENAAAHDSAAHAAPRFVQFYGRLVMLHRAWNDILASPEYSGLRDVLGTQHKRIREYMLRYTNLATQSLYFLGSVHHAANMVATVIGAAEMCECAVSAADLVIALQIFEWWMWAVDQMVIDYGNSSSDAAALLEKSRTNAWGSTHGMEVYTRAWSEIFDILLAPPEPFLECANTKHKKGASSDRVRVRAKSPLRTPSALAALHYHLQLM